VGERIDMYFYCFITLLSVQHSVTSAMLLIVVNVSQQAESTPVFLPPSSFVLPNLMKCRR